MKKFVRTCEGINMIAVGMFIVGFSAVMFMGEPRLIWPNTNIFLTVMLGIVAIWLLLSVAVSNLMHQNGYEPAIMKDDETDALIAAPAVVAVVAATEVHFKMAGPFGWNLETALLASLVVFCLLVMWLSAYTATFRKRERLGLTPSSASR